MRGAAVALAAVVVLAGCGTDAPARTSAASDSTASEQPSPSPTDAASDGPSDKPTGKADKHDDKGGDEASPAVPAGAPACGAVWRDGQRLARDYDGCVAGGQFVTVDQEACSFGQRLVRFGDHFYAVRGGPVNRTAAPLTKDRDYRGAIASCRA